MAWYSTKRSTTVAEIDGMMVCIYHRTPVVQWDDTKIILRSGGWETYTTKAHMNEVAHHYNLGFSVYQKNHEWFVRPPGKGWDEVVPFVDGMELARC